MFFETGRKPRLEGCAARFLPLSVALILNDRFQKRNHIH